MAEWRLGHRPALDGLRGVAVLLVMLAHGHVWLFDHGGGRAGVTLFFALSGFLITALLVEELRDRGRVDLRAFYIRRALRLLPALVVLVAVLVALGWVTSGEALWSLSYVGNWYRAAGGDLGLLSHVWSLAIEEQFYIVFPVVFVALGRRPRVLGLVLVGTAVSSVLWRFHLWATTENGPRIYNGADTRADAILLGCALGVWFASGRARRVPMLAGIAGLAGLLLVTTAEGLRFHTWGATIAAVSSVMVVAFVVDRGAPVLELAPLRRCGRLSYGLYLWHVPLLWWFGERAPLTLPVVAVVLVLSFVAADASMRLVEQPFLRLKRRHGQPRDVTDPTWRSGSRERRPSLRP